MTKEIQGYNNCDWEDMEIYGPTPFPKRRLLLRLCDECVCKAMLSGVSLEDLRAGNVTVSEEIANA